MEYINIWYDIIWYDMIWYDMIWYDMIWEYIYDMIIKYNHPLFLLLDAHMQSEMVPGVVCDTKMLKRRVYTGQLCLEHTSTERAKAEISQGFRDMTTQTKQPLDWLKDCSYNHWSILANYCDS